MRRVTDSIYKVIFYNYKKYINQKSKNMNKQSIEETLRKSREVEQRYQKFLKEKIQSDKKWAQTQQKIDRTLNKLSQTKDTIKKIDKLYEDYQKSFENAINSALQKIQASKLLQVPDPDFVPHQGTPKQVADLLKKKKKIVFMTGAGVTAASGIPTFRDKDGYWTKKKLENITPEQFLTYHNFKANPYNIWQWLQDFYCTKLKCKPNIGHGSIDSIFNKMIDKNAEVCLITQNIDNFHVQSQTIRKQKKQDSKYPIYQVHGNILKVRCDQCAVGKSQIVTYPYTQFREIIKQKKTPTCPKCKQSIRPHIMFFDEFYNQKFHHSQSVKKFVEEADILVIIGTALQTGLARLTVEDCLSRKIDIIQINTQCTIRQNNVIWMQGKSQQILIKINQNL